MEDLEFKYRGAEANVTRWAARLADVDSARELLSRFAKVYELDARNARDDTKAHKAK